MYVLSKRSTFFPFNRYPARTLKNHASILLAVACVLFLLYTYRSRDEISVRHGRALHHPPISGQPLFHQVKGAEKADDAPHLDLGEALRIVADDDTTTTTKKTKTKTTKTTKTPAVASGSDAADTSESASPKKKSKETSKTKGKSSKASTDAEEDVEEEEDEDEDTVEGTKGAKAKSKGKEKEKTKGADKTKKKGKAEDDEDEEDAEPERLSAQDQKKLKEDEENAVAVTGEMKLSGKKPSDMGISVEMVKSFMKPTVEPPSNPQDLSTTIVVGRLDGDPAGVKWIHNLKDISHKKIYIVDDPNAPLHLDRNKGRESAVYLRYIVDNYNHLDDVTIFFHSSRKAWHNNALFEGDGAVMIDQLRREHVKKVGYFNMRCELYPGCQRWIKFDPDPDAHWAHPERGADMFTTSLWKEMFPNVTSYPNYLAEPCCSQFAVSREMIRSWPLDYWRNLYDWLTTTRTNDGYAGRVMEYVWQYAFLGVDEHCPSMRECYCSGYGVCMENEAQLVEYNDIRGKIDEILTVLGEWNKKECEGRFDTKEETDKCKKKNPYIKGLDATRKKKWDYEAAFAKAIGIKYP